MHQILKHIKTDNTWEHHHFQEKKSIKITYYNHRPIKEQQGRPSLNPSCLGWSYHFLVFRAAGRSNGVGTQRSGFSVRVNGAVGGMAVAAARIWILPPLEHKKRHLGRHQSGGFERMGPRRRPACVPFNLHLVVARSGFVFMMCFIGGTCSVELKVPPSASSRRNSSVCAPRRLLNSKGAV